MIEIIFVYLIFNIIHHQLVNFDNYNTNFCHSQSESSMDCMHLFRFLMPKFTIQISQPLQTLTFLHILIENSGV